jgi:hypothetical protein
MNNEQGMMNIEVTGFNFIILYSLFGVQYFLNVQRDYHIK